MNSMLLNESASRYLLSAFAVLLTACLLQWGCASRHVQPSAGKATNLSAHVTFYTVPFR